MEVKNKTTNSTKKWGSRVEVWAELGDSRKLVGYVDVPHRSGINYCKQHPKGVYAQELETLKLKAQKMEDAHKTGEPTSKPRHRVSANHVAPVQRNGNHTPVQKKEQEYVEKSSQIGDIRFNVAMNGEPIMQGKAVDEVPLDFLQDAVSFLADHDNVEDLTVYHAGVKWNVAKTNQAN